MCCLTCEGAIGKGSTEREEPNKVQLLLTFMAFSHVYYTKYKAVKEFRKKPEEMI